MTADKPDSNNQQSSESNLPTFEAETKAAGEWVKNIAQTLIQWMPTGGSGWIFVSFLLEQEWIMALITFPVTIVAVIWARYSTSVLTRLGEIYQQRGRKDVDDLMSWLQKVDKDIKEAIKWQLAGTEDKYLRCQGNACRQYMTEGLSSTFKPLLKDVFVPLSLSGDFWRHPEGGFLPRLPGFKSEEEIGEFLQAQAENRLTIWAILRRAKKDSAYRRLTIQAWGGYGKTTLLRHVTYIYTHKLYQKKAYQAPELLPVLLYLRQWQDLIASENPPDLPTLIEKHHLPRLPEGKKLQLPPNWAKNLLDKGKMLIMLDGFDEVKEIWRKSVSQWIDEQMSNYYPSFFILTSRPAGYQDFVVENKPNSLFIEPFNAAQRERFIQRWYLSRERHYSAEPDNPAVTQEAEQKAASLVQQLSQRQELRDLAKNPLLLNLMVTLHSSLPFDPTNQVKLP